MGELRRGCNGLRIEGEESSLLFAANSPINAFGADKRSFGIG
jgi:hypothetical protein